MKLYLRSIALHFPNTYERIDFKNMSTERGEGFFARLSTILIQCTGRDLQSEATFREVYVLLGLGAHHAMDIDEEEVSNKWMGKAFAGTTILLFSILLFLCHHHTPHFTHISFATHR